MKDHYDCSLLHVCIQLSLSMLHCKVRVVFKLVYLVALLFSLCYSLLYCNGRGHRYALGARGINQLSVCLSVCLSVSVTPTIGPRRSSNTQTDLRYQSKRRNTIITSTDVILSMSVCLSVCGWMWFLHHVNSHLNLVIFVWHVS